MLRQRYRLRAWWLKIIFLLCVLSVEGCIGGNMNPKRTVRYEPEEVIGPGTKKQSPVTSQPVTTSFPPERRLALLIGNATYHHTNKLANPVNDARSMQQALQRLQFRVITHENIRLDNMKQVIDEFGQLLKGYDVGLFYYSGHGIQVNGENYLLPIDADPQTEKMIEYHGVNVGRLLANMEDANNQTNIIILDACRNNPFKKSWRKGSSEQGLAFINAPSGTLIAYATAPGSFAYDDLTKSNSPYTYWLLRYIETPHITIEEMFKHVRVQVEKEKEHLQIPWESTSLRGNFYFKR